MLDPLQSVSSISKPKNIAAGALYRSMGILLRPEWAALAMSASTVTMTINALLLNRVRFAAGRQPLESSMAPECSLESVGR